MVSVEEPAGDVHSSFCPLRFFAFFFSKMAQDATHKTKIIFALRRKKKPKTQKRRHFIRSRLEFFLREGGGIKELAMRAGKEGGWVKVT